MRCPNPECGRENPPGESFCQNCGWELQPLAPGAAAAVPGGPPAGGAAAPGTTGAIGSPCAICGRPVKPGARFCGWCGSPMQAAPLAVDPGALPPGTLVAEKIRITKVLAKGGMGFLYLGEDTVLQRPVVLKTLVRGDDVELARQQIEEYRALAGMKHPNIVGCYEVLRLNGRPTIVMEYVQGETLNALMEQTGAPIPVPEAIRYIQQIVPAFSYLHHFEGGALVYQDFKPQNVMRERLKDGSYRLVLIDLGTVVRAGDRSRPVWGTPGYHAPELAGDHQSPQRPSPATDLYTIGRALLELVTGMNVSQPAYGVPSPADYPVLLQYPPLHRFLLRACHAEPAARFLSADEMADQLAGVLHQIDTAEARPDRPFPSTHFLHPSQLALDALGPLGAPVLDARDPAWARLQAGDVYLRVGDRATAARHYAQAVQAFPQSYQARLRLYDCLGPGAGEHLAAALKLQPPVWQVLWYQAREALGKGDLPQAQKRCEALVLHLPGEIAPQAALAHLHRLRGAHDQAFTTLIPIASADPGNPQIIGDLAAALRRTAVGAGQLAAIAPVLERLQAVPEFSPGHLLQGDFYRAAKGLSRRGARELAGHSWPGVQGTGPEAFGRAAESGYHRYLQRVPEAPDREEIVRAKLAAANWRWV